MPRTGTGSRLAGDRVPGQDGRLLGHCRNTPRGVQHFTENKTKTYALAQGSSTREVTMSPLTSSPESAELVYHTCHPAMALPLPSLTQRVLIKHACPLEAGWGGRLASTAQERRNDSVNIWWSRCCRLLCPPDSQSHSKAAQSLTSNSTAATQQAGKDPGIPCCRVQRKQVHHGCRIAHHHLLC